MDLNFLRSAVTLASFIGFLGIVVWAYSPRRKNEIEEVGAMLLRDAEGGVSPKGPEAPAPTGDQR